MHLSRKKLQILYENSKSNKTAGIDNIAAELIKYGGQPLHDKTNNLILSIWESEVMPSDWEEGILVVLHIKYDRTVTYPL